MVVTESDILDRFASKYCYSDADPILTKKRSNSNRDPLDRDPAIPGEQVQITK